MSELDLSSQSSFADDDVFWGSVKPEEYEYDYLKSSFKDLINIEESSVEKTVDQNDEASDFQDCMENIDSFGEGRSSSNSLTSTKNMDICVIFDSKNNSINTSSSQNCSTDLEQNENLLPVAVKTDNIDQEPTTSDVYSEKVVDSNDKNVSTKLLEDSFCMAELQCQSFADIMANDNSDELKLANNKNDDQQTANLLDTSNVIMENQFEFISPPAINSTTSTNERSNGSSLSSNGFMNTCAIYDSNDTVISSNGSVVGMEGFSSKTRDSIHHDMSDSAQIVVVENLIEDSFCLAEAQCQTVMDILPENLNNTQIVVVSEPLTATNILSMENDIGFSLENIAESLPPSNSELQIPNQNVINESEFKESIIDLLDSSNHLMMASDEKMISTSSNAVEPILDLLPMNLNNSDLSRTNEGIESESISAVGCLISSPSNTINETSNIKRISISIPIRAEEIESGQAADVIPHSNDLLTFSEKLIAPLEVSSVAPAPAIIDNLLLPEKKSFNLCDNSLTDQLVTGQQNETELIQPSTSSSILDLNFKTIPEIDSFSEKQGPLNLLDASLSELNELHNFQPTIPENESKFQDLFALNLTSTTPCETTTAKTSAQIEDSDENNIIIGQTELIPIDVVDNNNVNTEVQSVDEVNQINASDENKEDNLLVNEQSLNFSTAVVAASNDDSMLAFEKSLLDLNNQNNLYDQFNDDEMNGQDLINSTNIDDFINIDNLSDANQSDNNDTFEQINDKCPSEKLEQNISVPKSIPTIELKPTPQKRKLTNSTTKEFEPENEVNASLQKKAKLSVAKNRILSSTNNPQKIRSPLVSIRKNVLSSENKLRYIPNNSNIQNRQNLKFDADNDLSSANKPIVSKLKPPSAIGSKIAIPSSTKINSKLLSLNNSSSIPSLCAASATANIFNNNKNNKMKLPSRSENNNNNNKKIQFNSKLTMPTPVSLLQQQQSSLAISGCSSIKTGGSRLPTLAFSAAARRK